MGRRGGGSSGGRSFGGGGGRSFGGRSSGGSFSRGSSGSSRSSFGFSGRSSGGSGSGRSFGSGSSGLFGGRSSSGSSSNSGLFGSGSSRSGGYGSGRAYRGSYGPQGGVGCSGCGCLTVPFTVIIAVVLIVLIIMLIPTCLGSGGDINITKSTIERQPLPRGSVTETGYYTDTLGWIGNKTKLTTGMKNFYQKTGVQPYLYITDNINGSYNPTDEAAEDFAYSLYENLFRDEAHLLLIFMESYPNDYSTWYLAGRAAKTVIDTEAADILLDYIDRYYSYDLTDEEFFSKAFNDAGKRIMTVYKSPWPIVVWTILAIIILLIALYWWRKAKEQKNREAEATERILNTPLDTFGDQEAEELAKKYQDDPNSIPTDPNSQSPIIDVDAEEPEPEKDDPNNDDK